MKEETWKLILENKRSKYYVSTTGRCKQIVKRTGETIITNGKVNEAIGYAQFAKDYVHRHVAKAFIPNPNNYEQVDHINSVRTDNRVQNLRWVSRKTNNSTKHALEQHHKNNTSTHHANEIVKATKNGETRYFKNGALCARELGCTRTLVYNAINHNGSAKKAKGWTLEYVQIRV